MNLTTRQHENAGISESVYNCMDFGGSSSTTNTNRLVLGIVHISFLHLRWLCAL